MSDKEGSENEGSGSGEEATGNEESSSSKGKFSADEKDASHTMYQIFVFMSCFLGHCLYIYNRKVFQYVLPHIMNEHNLSGIEVGLVIMMQMLGFTISSFFAGVYLDSGNAKPIFALGTFLTGFFNFGFSDVDEPTNMIMLATFSGIGQGLGWPCCVKVIRYWFPTQSFGFWWAMISQSYFLVGLIGSPIANSWAADYGWRVSIQMPAVISMVIAAALFFTLFEKPSDVGYEDPVLPRDETHYHWQDLLGSELMLLLCGSGFLLNMIRQGALDWGQLYLMDEKGLAVYNAAYHSASMEFGGALGGAVCGAVADIAIRKKWPKGYFSYPRIILLLLCTAGGGIVLTAFILVLNAYSSTIQVNLYGLLMGFVFSSAIQQIEALTIECSPPNRIGSCYALVNFSINMSAIMAGIPLSLLAASYGWTKTFFLLNFALLVAFFGMLLGKDIHQSFIPGEKNLIKGKAKRY